MNGRDYGKAVLSKLAELVPKGETSHLRVREFARLVNQSSLPLCLGLFGFHHPFILLVPLGGIQLGSLGDMRAFVGTI